MSEFMNINGVNIHYRITGPEDGIKVMFSNSLATNFSMWDPQVEAMAKDFRILCYDKRGHGQSETFDQEITINWPSYWYFSPTNVFVVGSLCNIECGT